MKNIWIALLVFVLALSTATFSVSPVCAQSQPSPPLSPDESWQPPTEGGDFIEPPVAVETYSQTWSNLQISPPLAVVPGNPGAIVNAYLVNSYGQILTNLHLNEACYLLISVNSPGYFYLWEYYPPTTTPYGHWLCYRWYRPHAGIWRIGPFAAESFDPAGRYVWKMWFLSGSYWSTRSLSFNYSRNYYLPYQVEIPGLTPRPIPSPVINSFSANKSSIEAGETAILTWTTTNASSVTISPGVGAVAASGSTSVTPAATTTYTLVAKNQSGSSASSTSSITVKPRIPPTISSGQATIQKGQSTSLSWSAPGAIQLSITGIGHVSAIGTTEVSPDETITYTLTATYIDGTKQSVSVTINVEQPPYLLWGLIALLAVAIILLVIFLIRRFARGHRIQEAETQGGIPPQPATTHAADTLPATTPVVTAASAKLAIPGGKEILLAGNARSFGRQDFKEFMPQEYVSYISRQHVNIWYENDQYYIEDRSSTNGTRVNGRDIKGTGRQVLADGDVIELAGKLSIPFKR